MSEKGCNGGALSDNDTVSTCEVGEKGVGCWVSIQQALSVNRAA